MVKQTGEVIRKGRAAITLTAVAGLIVAGGLAATIPQGNAYGADETRSFTWNNGEPVPTPPATIPSEDGRQMNFVSNTEPVQANGDEEVSQHFKKTREGNYQADGSTNDEVNKQLSSMVEKTYAVNEDGYVGTIPRTGFNVQPVMEEYDLPQQDRQFVQNMDIPQTMPIDGVTYTLSGTSEPYTQEVNGEPVSYVTAHYNAKGTRVRYYHVIATYEGDLTKHVNNGSWSMTATYHYEDDAFKDQAQAEYDRQQQEAADAAAAANAANNNNANDPNANNNNANDPNANNANNNNVPGETITQSDALLLQNNVKPSNQNDANTNNENANNENANNENTNEEDEEENVSAYGENENADSDADAEDAEESDNSNGFPLIPLLIALGVLLLGLIGLLLFLLLRKKKEKPAENTAAVAGAGVAAAAVVPAAVLARRNAPIADDLQCMLIELFDRDDQREKAILGIEPSILEDVPTIITLPSMGGAHFEPEPGADYYIGISSINGFQSDRLMVVSEEGQLVYDDELRDQFQLDTAVMTAALNNEPLDAYRRDVSADLDYYRSMTAAAVGGNPYAAGANTDDNYDAYTPDYNEQYGQQVSYDEPQAYAQPAYDQQDFGQPEGYENDPFAQDNYAPSYEGAYEPQPQYGEPSAYEPQYAEPQYAPQPSYSEPIDPYSQQYPSQYGGYQA